MGITRTNARALALGARYFFLVGCVPRRTIRRRNKRCIEECTLQDYMEVRSGRSKAIFDRGSIRRGPNAPYRLPLGQDLVPPGAWNQLQKMRSAIGHRDIVQLEVAAAARGTDPNR